MKRILKAISRILFPPGSKRRKKFEKTLRKLGIHRTGIDPMYQLVLDKSNGIQRILPDNLNIKKTPLISIVVPTYNPNKVYFETLLNSVLDQSYENFELIIADGSTEAKIIKYIAQVKDYDTRIKHIKIVNKGISATTNAGIKAAEGEYIALLDHDDILHPDALLFMAAGINEYPDGDLFYSDECKLSENGEIFRIPHFKPDFSPDLLFNLNYITHFAVINSKIFARVGLFDTSKDGAQDYDMFLRIADQTKNIYHIPKILYFWRESKSSTAQAFENKKDLAFSGINALKDHYQRTKQKAKVKLIKDTPGFYEAEIDTAKKRVAVLIAEKNPLLLSNYEKYIQKNTKTSHYVEWFVVPSGKSDITQLVSSLQNRFDMVVTIADLALPINKKWLNVLISHLSQKHIGIISPTLVDNFGRIVYKGEVKINDDIYPIFMGLEHNDRTNFGDVNWNRNVDSITKGIICFKTSLITKTNYSDLQSLIKDVNDECNKKELYKTSLGRCYMEQVSGGYGDFETMLKSSRFFNSNLRQYGYYENLPIGNSTQLPVTNRYNVLVDPNE